MGIDVYLNWNGQTKAEKEAQYTGFSIVSGHVGYLREAYHGGPYATRILINEDLDNQPDEGFTIPAAELKRRLPATVMAAIYRHEVVYGDGSDPAVVNLDDADGLEQLVAKLAHAFAKKEKFEILSELISTRQLPDYALSFVDFVQLAEIKEAQTGAPCRVQVSA